MDGSEGRPRAISGAILAGGRARRFGGRDKGSLLVEGRRIVERQVEALRAIASHVMIVGGDPSRYAGLDAAFVPDQVPDAGPLAGLHAALAAAPPGLLVAVACDLPFVTSRFLAHLVDGIGDADACVPRDAMGVHPLCACYATRCAPVFAARLAAGQRKVVDAVAGLRRVEIGPEDLARVDPSGRVLTNVNTAEDYAALTRPR